MDTKKLTPMQTETQTIKAGKKGKAPQLSSADKLRQKILAEKQTTIENDGLTWWKGQVEVMKVMPNDQKAEHVKALLRNKRSNEGSLAVEIRLFKLNLELLMWIADKDAEESVTRDRFTASIVKQLKDICTRKGITPTALKIIRNVLTSLGLETIYESLAATPTAPSPDRALEFTFVKLIKSKTKTVIYPFMSIKEHPTLWQLRLFGEYMDRSMDGAPDLRVSFEPDAWQRKVLDSIDRSDSMLVVGKGILPIYIVTISFHAHSTDKRWKDVHFILRYGAYLEVFGGRDPRKY